jgi:hypothetical protein
VRIAQLEKSSVKQLSDAEIKDLIHMKDVSATCVNPDSKEVIPWPARTSAFIPTNIPIVGGMMLSAPTYFNTFLWQWINQTYNAGLNFGNRNASSSASTQETLISYLFAATTAVSLGLLMRRMTAPLMRGNEGTLKGQFITSTVCVVAGGGTSTLNMYIMRRKELETGISVTSADGTQTFGQSKIAAESGIFKTGICRIALAFSCYVVPLIPEAAMRMAGILSTKTSPSVRMGLNLFNLSCGLVMAIPINNSVFPQYCKIPVD